MANPFSTVALEPTYEPTPSGVPQGGGGLGSGPGPMGGVLPPAQKKTMFFHALFKVPPLLPRPRARGRSCRTAASPQVLAILLYVFSSLFFSSSCAAAPPAPGALGRRRPDVRSSRKGTC